ncbi:MAG: BNR-4 repeat-containing protein [Candidatus Babeliales bacterium]|nr:BNR-4 repeat-containing protein [Candidatus Babeliales bacterium]
MKIHTQNGLLKIKGILAVLVIGLLVFDTVRADDLVASAEFTVPYNQANGAEEPFTPLVHFGGQSYVVWLDSNCRPWVTQKGDSTQPIQVPLDANSDYTAFPDGHHRFSMGIDKYGYLHVTGDMHYYPSVPAAYLPARYQNQTVMYWVSNKPYDVSGGFTFAGGANATTAIPGQYFNTGHFFNDNNRELYFTGMVRAYQSWSARETGEQGVGLYKYNADQKTWSIIGDYGDGVYPAADNVSKWKVLYWEYAGVGNPGWFQNFWPSFAFDHNNHLHFAVSSCVNLAYQGATRLLYAVSKDGGLTWSKANGQKIPGLPLRGADSAANCADVVFDTKGTSLLGVASWVVPDVEGNPCVTVNVSSTVDPVWRRWNGAAWTNDISSSHKCMGSSAFLGPDGNISFFKYATLRRTPGLIAFSAEYNLQAALGFSRFDCISDIGLKDSNSLYCLARNDSSTASTVAKITFINHNLPFGWDHRDIGSAIPLGGDADYYNGTFTIRSSGMGVANAADNIHYGYRFLTGDGSIVARLAGNADFRANAVDGIMIRESLDPSSKCVMLGKSAGGSNYFNYRSATGGIASSFSVYAAPGNWMKLVRAGQTFTAYSSADGVNWVQIGTSQIITMAQTVYVGLMGWSTGPLSEMHIATLDQVNVTNW